MSDLVARVEAFSITIPRAEVYLGGLRAGEVANDRGYFIRKGNRTVYPVFDRSVLVRIETRDGIVGWGETYGIVAPRAPMAIIDDLLGPFVVGRDPGDVAVIHEDLYDMMRVRGYSGGYYLDALAAIDIALWDIAGKRAGLPLARLLGGRRRETIPAYVSGLPRPTRPERVAFAKEWQAKGFDAFKIAMPVSDGTGAEIAALRAALGREARIACDMHWGYSAAEAVRQIDAMAEHGLWFAEAPVNPEDIEGLAAVARMARVPVAAGEEWRTVFEARPRIDRGAVSIIQPEMGHTGITQFMRIARYAEAHHLDIIPHATIGIGIFLAASLQASAALQHVSFHEYQHSIFEPNRRLIRSTMDCRAGFYHVPDGAGLGVEPSEEALKLLER